MHWGSARYNDVGFEGWGCLPLASFADLDSAQLSQLAAEHSLLPANVGNARGDHQQRVLSRCQTTLTPRFVVTLHDDPWVGKLSIARVKHHLLRLVEQLVSPDIHLILITYDCG